MKIKSYFIVDFILVVLKIVVAIFFNCYTVLADAVYNLYLIVLSLFSKSKKENKKYKGIVTSLVSFLYLLLAIFFLFYVCNAELKSPSMLIILFLLLFFIIRYSVSCFVTTKNFNLRKGLLSFNNDKSNMCFINYGIILVVVILSKVSRWVPILRYADRVGVVLILLFLSIKILRVIGNSFKVMEDNFELDLDEVKREIIKRSEVDSVSSIKVNAYGGVRSLILEAKFNRKLSTVDINTFMLTLGDYLLNKSEVCYIIISEKENLIKKVSSNARNSGSRNSKKNTKGKNTRKKNKKR